MAQDAYVTMLLTDNYLQGAQVVASSLRDGGTTKKLAVIVPAEGTHRLLPTTISQLEECFDFVIPMPTLSSRNYANLRLMDRPDLALTLTKVNLWRLVQFRKCVYLDADVLALRAPDELFDLDVEFAAAPDVGWPDIFNSGVFLFKPSMATYFALKTLAESGITFDGGDQGLLNTFFPAYHRLSFTYNVTPSTNYQYTPAYRHFSSNISLFHFIGKLKPWFQRSYSGGDSYNEATGRWWSVYEKHYGWKIREEELKQGQEDAIYHGQDTTPRPSQYSQPQPYRPKRQVSFGGTETVVLDQAAPAPQLHQIPPPRGPSPPPFEPQVVPWDPARSAPPSDSGPQAKDLSIATYESAWDRPYNPHEPKWVPPPRSPLPKGYVYTPPAHPAESSDTSSESEEEYAGGFTGGYQVSDVEGQKNEDKIPPVFPWELRNRSSATRVFPGDVKGKDTGKTAERRPSLDKYEFTNAWDSLPIIQGYVKQQLGETLAPRQTEAKPKVESPSTSSLPKDILAGNKVTNAIDGERWDPNKQLDKLKSGVIERLREQKTRSATTKSTPETDDPSTKISNDDGTH